METKARACEDGADDHPLNNGQQTGESVGTQGGHSLAAAQPHQEGFGEPGLPFGIDHAETPRVDAVIARCGMERSAACRSGAKGNNV